MCVHAYQCVGVYCVKVVGREHSSCSPVQSIVNTLPLTPVDWLIKDPMGNR